MLTHNNIIYNLFLCRERFTAIFIIFLIVLIWLIRSKCNSYTRFGNPEQTIYDDNIFFKIENSRYRDNLFFTLRIWCTPREGIALQNVFICQKHTVCGKYYNVNSRSSCYIQTNLIKTDIIVPFLYKPIGLKGFP